MSDIFIVKLGDKRIVFICTETGRFFKISGVSIRANGLIPKAVEVSATYIAELYARFGVKPKVKGKASKILKFTKEEAV